MKRVLVSIALSLTPIVIFAVVYLFGIAAVAAITVLAACVIIGCIAYYYPGWDNPRY